MDGSAQIRSLCQKSPVWTHPPGGAPIDSPATQPRHWNWGLLRVFLAGSMAVAALTAGHWENTSAARCCVVAAMAVVGVATAVFLRALCVLHIKLCIDYPRATPRAA